MPPKSIGSAVTLVSLSALTAFEAGGCHKRPESLASVTRSALPLLAEASGSNAPESSYSMSDYGLGPHPDLKHVCGHYELRADGRLITSDLFAAPIAPGQLRRVIEQERHQAADPTGRRPLRAEVNLVVDDGGHFAWPESCPKNLAAKARSVLIASRVL